MPFNSKPTKSRANSAQSKQRFAQKHITSVKKRNSTKVDAPIIVLFNKPFDVLCQFTDNSTPPRATLADFINVPNVYAAGRLDRDSEGLLLLTNCGQTQHKIADPKYKLAKTYWVQLEGDINDAALKQLATGVVLNDGPTLPARVEKIMEPDVWPRTPPIRQRQNIPTSWISLTITEGRNRQVRRMTAAVGFPTLRLIRANIGDWSVADLAPGQFKIIEMDKGL